MKGIPSNPVECSNCHQMTGAPKDSLCHRCRPVVRGFRTKYHWTAEKDALIRGVWTAGYNRFEAGRKSKELATRWGVPHSAIKRRAAQLRLTREVRQFWKPEEIQFLEESAGTLTVTEIAKKLHRSVVSVRSRFETMHISRRIVDGFGTNDLVEILGVSGNTVGQWERQGWIVRQRGRFSEAVIRQFLCEHPEQYDLRRVDQQIFKSILFPKASCFDILQRRA